MAKDFRNEYSFYNDHDQRRKHKRLKAGLFSSFFVLIFLLTINMSMVEVKPAEYVIAADVDIFAAKPPEKNPFSSFSNYLEDKLDEYKIYQLKFPEKEVLDVIWQVNVSLNFDFYTNVNQVDTVMPILVNKYNQLSENYVPDKLVELDYGHLVTPGTKEAFARMRKDAISQGYTIDAASGYRSFNEQKSLNTKLADSLGQEIADQQSARAGFSEHQTGRAIDITGSIGGLDEFEKVPEFKWIIENCENYGFIIRYPKDCEQITGYMSEPWHITFVGKSIALDMKEKSIKTLEEYVGKNLDVLDIKFIDDRRVVAVDAGHGGADPGGSRNDVNEKKY